MATKRSFTAEIKERNLTLADVGCPFLQQWNHEHQTTDILTQVKIFRAVEKSDMDELARLAPGNPFGTEAMNSPGLTIEGFRIFLLLGYSPVRSNGTNIFSSLVSWSGFFDFWDLLAECYPTELPTELKKDFARMNLGLRFIREFIRKYGPEFLEMNDHCDLYMAQILFKEGVITTEYFVHFLIKRNNFDEILWDDPAIIPVLDTHPLIKFMIFFQKSKDYRAVRSLFEKFPSEIQEQIIRGAVFCEGERHLHRIILTALNDKRARLFSDYQRAFEDFFENLKTDFFPVGKDGIGFFKTIPLTLETIEEFISHGARPTVQIFERLLDLPDVEDEIMNFLCVFTENSVKNELIEHMKSLLVTKPHLARMAGKLCYVLNNPEKI